MLHAEASKRDSIGVNHEHIRTYTFHLRGEEDFVLTVDSEHMIRAYVSVYWEEGGTFLESRFQRGQEVRLLIYQDRQTVLINEIFYQTTGFAFMAYKGHQYLLRFLRTGTDKLVMLSMENYLSDSRADEAISAEHLESHERRTKAIRSKMGVRAYPTQTYLAVVEHNAYVNEKIAQKVLRHTQSYMAYQAAEVLVMVLTTLSQVFLIRRLLRRDSVV